MREPLTRERLEQFMRLLGRELAGETTCYLTGGTTAVFYGWRETTVDVDLCFQPEPTGAGQAIARIKQELRLNVEQASPGDFVPLPRGWDERSPFVAKEGGVTFRHFDLYSQALAKVERSHAHDVDDVRAMVERGLVEPDTLRRYFEEIEPRLVERFELDPGSFSRRLEHVLGG
jgi:hypothetical protein